MKNNVCQIITFPSCNMLIFQKKTLIMSDHKGCLFATLGSFFFLALFFVVVVVVVVVVVAAIFKKVI